MNLGYCGLPTERKCLMCGKLFCAREEWVFTRGKDSHKLWLCSWKCLREYDEKQEKLEKKPNKIKDEIMRLLAEGESAKDIANELGIRQSMVYYYDELYGTSSMEG